MLPAPVTGESYTGKPIMQQCTESTTEDNPDVEVIALSPRTLTSTNRFTCEICNKKFLRHQNLQLHKRGHKVFYRFNDKKQSRPTKKVYVCPEPTCLHHSRSHTIGDLAGLKKHYHRKHGEKKWECEKCLRRYAVQSDWKAHCKICGSKDFRCDCGLIFSRHESFIDHWANCGTSTQETTENPTVGFTVAAPETTENPTVGFTAAAPETTENSTVGFTAVAVPGNRRLFKTITSLSLDNLSHITPAEHSNTNNEQEQGSNNGGTESEKLIPSSDLFNSQGVNNHQEIMVNDQLTIDDFSDIISFFSDSNNQSCFSCSVSQENALFSCENNLNTMDAVQNMCESETIIQNSVLEEPSEVDRGFSSSSQSSSGTTGIKNFEELTEEDDRFLGDLFGWLINE